jgi:hypothetical protein
LLKDPRRHPGAFPGRYTSIGDPSTALRSAQDDRYFEESFDSASLRMTGLLLAQENVISYIQENNRAIPLYSGTARFAIADIFV